MSQVLKCHRCGGILHTNESDIIGCLLESLKRAESKLHQSECRLGKLMELIENAHQYDSAAYFGDVLKQTLLAVERQSDK